MSTTLVPPEATAMIGQVTAGPVSALVTAREAQRYAQAVDDLNPVYFDEDAARAAGHRTLIAPPTFLEHVVVQGRGVGEMRVDGLFRDPTSKGLALKRVMFGGQEWEFLAPAHVGDTVTAVQHLTDITEKDGAKGPFVLVTWEWTFTDQRGSVIARCRQQGISR
jgi:acyl dehydratase